MKKVMLAIVGLAFMAGPVFCGPNVDVLTVSTGTNTTGTQSMRLNAYVDEIILDIPAGSVTGTLSVVSIPAYGDHVILASNTISADKAIRVRLDGTDSAGTALTGDPPSRYMAAMENIRFTVTAADPTGVTWRACIKYDDGK